MAADLPAKDARGIRSPEQRAAAAWHDGYDVGFRRGEEWSVGMAAVTAIGGALIGVTVGWLGHRRSSR